MGIKKLNTFLDEMKCIDIYENIDEYKNKFNLKDKKIYVGIDLLLYAYKYKYSINNIYIGFINQILFFLINKIIPIYVLDGKSPNEKIMLIKKRQMKKEKLKNKLENLNNNLINANTEEELLLINNEIQKNKKYNINIDNNDINNLLKLFNIFNVKLIRADGEADKYISDLNKLNIINFGLSDDIDIIVFGCNNLIKFKDKKIISYNLNNILNKLNLDYEQFIELCILFGCDYLKYNFKKNNQIIYNNYINSKNFNKFLELINYNVKNDKYFYQVKNIYLKEKSKIEFNKEYKLNLINYTNLIKFIIVYCKSYNIYKLNDKIIEINNNIINNLI